MGPDLDGGGGKENLLSNADSSSLRCNRRDSGGRRRTKTSRNEEIMSGSFPFEVLRIPASGERCFFALSLLPSPLFACRPFVDGSYRAMIKCEMK